MEGIASFLGALSRLVQAVLPAIDAYPWSAPLVAFAPAVTGLIPRSSIAGTFAGGMLGCAGFMAAYLGASWGAILWIVAWIAALGITARATR
jgi:hypothetical protein